MSVILTRTQNLREKANLDKNNLRPSNYGALDLFVTQNQSGGIVTPALIEKARGSIGSTLQTPVFDFDSSVSIGNTRSVTIADDENTTQMYNFLFTTYSFGFTQAPAAFMNNEIAAQDDFNVKMKKYILALGNVVDTAAIAAISASKTQVLGDNLDYPFVGNVVKAPWTKRELILGDINPMMKSNDYYGGIHILGNAGIESVVNKLAQKSIYNEANKTLEYSDKTFHFSNRLTNEQGIYGSGYAIEDGSLGFLVRHERESLLATKTPTHEWGIDTLPYLDIPCDTYYYYGVGDYNAIAGAATADFTRGVKHFFGFAIDLCFVTPYNSAVSTNASSILKFNIGSETQS